MAALHRTRASLKSGKEPQNWWQSSKKGAANVYQTSLEANSKTSKNDSDIFLSDSLIFSFHVLAANDILRNFVNYSHETS